MRKTLYPRLDENIPAIVQARPRTGFDRIPGVRKKILIYRSYVIITASSQIGNAARNKK